MLGVEVPEVEKPALPAEKKPPREPIVWEEGGGRKRKLAIGIIVIVVVVAVGVHLMGRTPSSSTTITKSGWLLVECPTDKSLNSIYMLSENEGWIVGSEGTILRWNGNSWSMVDCPSIQLNGSSREPWLNSVYMLSSNDGWAVGNAILHWNGGEWTVADAPVLQGLKSIFMLSENNGWAAGAFGILHWDGSTWSWSLEQRIERWDIRTGEVITQPPYFKSIYMLSENDGWVVGGDFLRSVIYHWDGNTWSEVEVPENTFALYSVYMLSSTDGWAGGRNALLHWNGERWSKIRSPTIRDVTSIQMISENEGWATNTDGDFYHWDGSKWSKIESPVPGRKYLNSVYMLSSNEGWAVGANGTILKYNPIEFSI